MNRKTITKISILALSLHILCFSYHEYNAYDHRMRHGAVNTYDNFHYSSHHNSSGLLGFIPVIGALVKKGYDALFGDSNALSKDEQRFVEKHRNWSTADFLQYMRNSYSYESLQRWAAQGGFYEDIPEQALFVQHQFYQFPVYQTILWNCFGFEDYLLSLKRSVLKPNRV